MDQAKKRNSSIELLRIISIFLIVLGHACRHGIIDNQDYSMQLSACFSNVAVYIFSAGGYSKSYIHHNNRILFGAQQSAANPKNFESVHSRSYICCFHLHCSLCVGQRSGIGKNDHRIGYARMVRFELVRNLLYAAADDDSLS